MRCRPALGNKCTVYPSVFGALLSSLLSPLATTKFQHDAPIIVKFFKRQFLGRAGQPGTPAKADGTGADRANGNSRSARGN